MARLERRADELSHAQLVTNAVTVAGKHVVIYAPPIEKANAERLIPMADDAVEYYAQNLNVSVPDEPFPIYLFETMREYEHAADVCNMGRNKANLAFSIGGQAFIYVQPRPGQTIVGNGSMLEELTAHELCHTLHERLFPAYDNQPLWLKEGVAQFWAESVLSHCNTLQANPGIRFSSRIVVVRRALQNHNWIPLAQLLQLSGDTFADNDSATRTLRYYESFALIHLLDDPRPENAARRAAFHDFLRFVNNLDGDDTEGRANTRFQEVFGGAHLPELEAEYIQQVQTEVVCP